MPRNYNTTTHNPYPRVTRIEILYPASGIPEISYDEQTAIVTGDGQVVMLDGAVSRNQLAINPPAFDDPIPLVNPTTGEVIPGQTTSLRALLIGMTAVLRHDQKRRDAAADGQQQG